MRGWLKLLIAIGALALGGLGVVAGIFLWAMPAHFNPPPPKAVASASADPLTRQREDVGQFARLVALDRSYAPAARREAQAAIAALAARPDVLPAPRFRMALMRIAALADNGHTTVYSGPDGEPNEAPIRLYGFADGVRVVRAEAPDADLLGAELVGVDGRPAEAALKVLDSYRGGTAAQRRRRSVDAITSPERLYGAGLTDDPARASYAFRLRERPAGGADAGRRAAERQIARHRSAAADLAAADRRRGRQLARRPARERRPAAGAGRSGPPVPPRLARRRLHRLRAAARQRRCERPVDRRLPARHPPRAASGAGPAARCSTCATTAAATTR